MLLRNKLYMLLNFIIIIVFKAGSKVALIEKILVIFFNWFALNDVCCCIWIWNVGRISYTGLPGEHIWR